MRRILCAIKTRALLLKETLLDLNPSRCLLSQCSCSVNDRGEIEVSLEGPNAEIALLQGAHHKLTVVLIIVSSNDEGRRRARS